MLFLPEEVDAEVERLLNAIAKPDADHRRLAARVLELDPRMAPVYLMASLIATKDGDLDLASQHVWKAMESSPTWNEPYVAAAEIQARLGNREMEDGLHLLAIWKVALADEVPETVAEHFREQMPPELDSTDPGVYFALARNLEENREESTVSPEVERKLRPYFLLNQLMREADDEIAPETMRAILDHGNECVPVFRGMLNDWVRDTGTVSPGDACMVVALLGEIGDIQALEDLIDLAGDDDLYLHVHWAIHRLAERHPREALDVFRKAIATADADWRCWLGEHLLLMQPAPGLADVLKALVDDFDKLARESNAASVLMMAVQGLKNLGRVQDAESLLKHHQSSLKKKDRQYLNDVLSIGFVSTLKNEGIEGPTIEDVCIERVLDDNGEEGDEDDEDDYIEPVEAAPKPGRNDPCWCGSGKKYKKCHLAADEAGKPPGNSIATEEHPENVIREIVDLGLEYDRAETTQAFKRYFGVEQASELDEGAIGNFAQWLMFDYRSSRTHTTTLERFAAEEAPHRGPRVRAFVESLLRARLALYEVLRVEPGRGIDLRNVYTDETVFVHDRSSSRELVKWDCMLGRLHTFEGKTMFAGAGNMVSRDFLRRFQAQIEKASSAAGQSPADYIAANSHRLHRDLKELYQEQLQNLRITTAEGDEMEFSQGHYEVLDQAVLLAALRAREDMVEESEAEGGGEYHFGWLEGPSRPEGTRSLGHIHIRGGRLRLETNSRQRLTKGKRLLEKIAKRAIKHLGDSSETIQAAMERRAHEGGAAEKVPSGIPPELEREVMAKFKAEHYATWPDHPLPALGGDTPREAVKTAAGRAAVIELLRTFENSEAREAQEGRAAYDFADLRRQLGLDRS